MVVVVKFVLNWCIVYWWFLGRLVGVSLRLFFIWYGFIGLWRNRIKDMAVGANTELIVLKLFRFEVNFLVLVFVGVGVLIVGMYVWSFYVVGAVWDFVKIVVIDISVDISSYMFDVLKSICLSSFSFYYNWFLGLVGPLPLLFQIEGFFYNMVIVGFILVCALSLSFIKFGLDGVHFYTRFLRFYFKTYRKGNYEGLSVFQKTILRFFARGTGPIILIILNIRLLGFWGVGCYIFITVKLSFPIFFLRLKKLVLMFPLISFILPYSYFFLLYWFYTYRIMVQVASSNFFLFCKSVGCIERRYKSNFSLCVFMYLLEFLFLGRWLVVIKKIFFFCVLLRISFVLGHELFIWFN